MGPKPVLAFWRVSISLFLSHFLTNECSRLRLVLNIVFWVKLSFHCTLITSLLSRKASFFTGKRKILFSCRSLESVVEKSSKFRIRSQANNSAIVSFYYGLCTFVKEEVFLLT